MIVLFAAINDGVRLFVVSHFSQRKGIAQNILRDPFEPRAIVFGNDCAIIDTESTVPPTADLIGGGLIDCEAKLTYETDDKGQKRAVLTAYHLEKAPRPDDEILLADFKPPTEEEKQMHEFHSIQTE